MLKAKNHNQRSYGLSVEDLRDMSLDRLKLEFTKWHMLSLESETLKQKASCESQKSKIERIIREKREEA